MSWEQMYDALKVLTLDETIREFLKGHDPKALEQALEALQIADADKALYRL